MRQGLLGVLLKQSLYPRDLLVRVLDGSRLVLDLGCGEGLLTNLLGRALPRTQFRGVDLDVRKIEVGHCAAWDNVRFRVGNLFSVQEIGASAVIFNDVLHHLPEPEQESAFALAQRVLDDEGILVLKEVDSEDRLDCAHTTFWDRRLYPGTPLNFRSTAAWHAIAHRNGFRVLEVRRVTHPWIASRTILVLTKRRRLAVGQSAPSRLAHSVTKPLRVLVTGGTGFVGEWVTRELLAVGIKGRPAQVTLLTRRAALVTATWGVRSDLRVIEADLARAPLPAEIGGQWDYVFHLAADVDYFGGSAVFQKNRQATINLLEAMNRESVSRFVFASTMGAVDRGRFDDCRQLLDERSPPHPTSPYGQAKVEEENLVKTSGLSYTILRLPWCFGEGMSPRHHVRKLLGAVRCGSLVTRFDWPGRVSLLSVDEAAKQFVEFATAEATRDQLCFVSDGEPIRFGELFAEMGRVVGRPAAGRTRIPSFVLGLARAVRGLLPFQLKALLFDALAVCDTRARSLGLATQARGDYFLDPLVGFDARETWPNRVRDTAVVTGAASGIGAAVARCLRAEGFSLCLVDKNPIALARLGGALRAQTRIVDLATLAPEGVVDALAGPMAPSVRIVINNAGIGMRGALVESSSSGLRDMIAINVEAVVFSTMKFSLELERRGGGTIVNIGSSAAFQPLPYMSAYAATKAFVHSFTLAVAAERPGRVRVLLVAPSGVKTRFQQTAGVATSPRERLLAPEDVAAAITNAIRSSVVLTNVGWRGPIMAAYASVVPLRVQILTWESLMRRQR